MTAKKRKSKPGRETQLKQLRKFAREVKQQPQTAIAAQLPQVRETIIPIKGRELVVRGYWDRYPSSDQKKHPNKYAGIDRSRRRGPTAYDLLLRDYNSFSAKDRKRLYVTVAYGFAPDTGELLSSRKIENGKMWIFLPEDRGLAMSALRTFLIRGGVVDTPKGWRMNKKEVKELKEVPLGIEWGIVEESPFESGGTKKAAPKKRSAKKAATKKAATKKAETKKAATKKRSTKKRAAKKATSKNTTTRRSVKNHGKAKARTRRAAKRGARAKRPAKRTAKRTDGKRTTKRGRRK